MRCPRFKAITVGAAVAAIAASTLLAPAVIVVEDALKATQRRDFEAFLADHPFDLDRQTYEEIARKEDPQARFMQEYLLMIDPVEKRLPVERLHEANRLAIAQRAMRKGQANAWVERGPDNVGGRTRAIMFDPNDPTHRKVWAGGVAGGLWVTDDITDPQAPWANVNDFWANIAISTIAHDPSNTQTFYVGTGEGWFNFDALRGAGVFKSTDGGSSWSQLPSTVGGSFRHVQDIVVTAAGTVLAATSAGQAVQRSTNGGQSWTAVLPASTSDGRGADLEIGPDGAIYASTGIFRRGELWRSTDDGVTWSLLNTGNNGFPNSGLERIEIAVAPSDPNRIYAVASAGGSLAGMYRSFDAGATWESMPLPIDCDTGIPENDFGRGQSWYNLILAVNPTDEDDLIAGAIDLFRTVTAGGGASWTQLGVWYQWSSCAGIPKIHADHHVVVHRPGSAGEVVFGHDGGISYSPDVSQSPVTFINRNQNYNVTQFYSIAVGAGAGSNLMVGGAQDNGTPQLNQAGLSSEVQDVTGGDGAYAHISQNGSQVGVASNQWLRWHRSLDGGATFSYVGGLSGGGSFINPSDMDDDTHHLFFNYDENRIGRLNNLNSNPITWDGLGPAGGFGAVVTHVRNSEYAPAGKASVFVGTRSGSLWKVENAEVGATAVWTQIQTTSLPVGAISSIDLIGSEQRMLVTLSNYGVPSVWLTEDGGASWTDLDTGLGLPDMPVWWGLADPGNPDQIYLATEAGLWRLPSISSGSSWFAEPDIPTTRVVMLEYRKADGRLAAATHGRGVWTTTLSNVNTPQLALSVFLQGAYRGEGEMATTASFAGAIPTEQPYGPEAEAESSKGADQNSTTLPNNVIDWIRVSLRSGVSAGTEVSGSATSALVTDDGTVIGADGNLIEFDGISPGSYYVVVQHRNHLAVMSSEPVDFSGGFGSWDFTAGQENAHSSGRVPMADLGEGRTGLFGADASTDGQITVADFDDYLTQTKAATVGYTSADFNLDGHVTALDFQIFLRNSAMAASSQVP